MSNSKLNKHGDAYIFVIVAFSDNLSNILSACISHKKRWKIYINTLYHLILSKYFARLLVTYTI